MALLVHSGVSASDLNASGTKREDISDVLLASLYFENNMLGLTQVGEEFADLQLKWVEDSLNAYKITDATGFAATTTTTMNVSATADQAVLDIGYLLQKDTTIGASSTEEIIQVTAISGATVTVTRGFASTTAATTGATTVWRIINAPTYQNSDLGKDFSRARISKSNWINRFELNVNIDSEQIARSRHGYAPGVRDELQYQFQQRLLELKRKMQMAYWFSMPKASPDGSDYSSFYGLIPWLNGAANSTAAPTTTSELLSDAVLNTMAKNVFKQGGFSNLLVGGINATEKVSQLYSDRIRIEQNERGRGFFAQFFTPSMANEHRIVTDPYLNDTSGSAQVMVLDLTRIRIRPFVDQFFYVITAPTFRDGDAVRALSKWSLEVRNTGTDSGYSHQLHTGLSV